MQCVQYHALYDISNISVDREAKHFILGRNMHIIKVKYRNMEFIIASNISSRNHHLHKIPKYISFCEYFNIIETKVSYKIINVYFNLKKVSIKLDFLDWPVTNLHDNGVCMST